MLLYEICSKYAPGKNSCLFIGLEVTIDWSFSFAFICCARTKFQPLLDGFSHSCYQLATHLSVVAAAVGVLWLAYVELSANHQFSFPVKGQEVLACTFFFLLLLLVEDL